MTAQLGAGRPVGEIKVPTGDPDCKTNLFRWLSQAVDELNKDPAGIVHCWEETKLLRAWEGAVQAEAAGKANELFPNSSRDDYLCRPTSRRTQRPASCGTSTHRA